MSASVTRTSSFQAPSRTASSSYVPTRESSMSTEHTTRLSHKLKHMFDQQRFTVFEPLVVIEEIDSLVGPKGSVVCEYKFRGKTVKEKDIPRSSSQSNVPSPRPSVPNLKLSAMSGSTSSLSLKSQPSLPAPRSVHGSSRLLPLSPEKAKTMPPALPSSSPAVPTLHSTRKHDPTPLRQSVGPDLQRVESPDALVPDLTESHTPEAIDLSDHVDDRRMSVPSVHSGVGSSAFTESTRTSLSNGSGEPMSNRQGSGFPPSISVRAPSTTSSLGLASVPAATFPKLSSVHAEGRRLDVPLARSGTVASPLTLIGRLPSRAAYDKMVRQEDFEVKSDASDTSATDKRERHTSTPAPPPVLSHRRGITPRAAIKGTTVRIVQRLTPGPLRIPLGEPIMPPPLPGLASPSRMQRPRPRLGEGSLSESGVKLEFWLHPDPKHEPAKVETKDDGSVQAQDHYRAPPRERLGLVNFDLAPFAGFGKGQHTRSYLLKECTVNASVRITVTMKQVGGEDVWAAPPDETHRGGDLRELVGDDLGESLQHELLRTTSPAGSDNESDLESVADSSLGLAPSISISSMNRPSQSRYKSYEHHLRPDAQRNLGHGRPANPSKLSIPASSSSSSPTSPHAITPRSASPVSPQVEAKSQEDIAAASSQSQLFQRLHKHPHHTHHLRHNVHPDQTIHPTHPNHTVILRSGELAPETVIEAIFSPHAAKTEGPFTFVPEGGHASLARLVSENEIFDQLAHGPNDQVPGEVHSELNALEVGQANDETARQQEAAQKTEGAKRRRWLSRRREPSERPATLAL